jgi:hypothetical protein
LSDGVTLRASLKLPRLVIEDQVCDRDRHIDHLLIANIRGMSCRGFVEAPYRQQTQL